MLERGSIAAMSKQLNEHMYLVVRSLKSHNNKIDYVMQRGDIIKLGRIKFAVKEISIVEETMEVDEGNQQKVLHRHANVESVDDEEFFEFQEVEAYYNMHAGDGTEHEDSSVIGQTQTSNVSDKAEVPNCRFCWSSSTQGDKNPLISSCKCAGGIRYIHLNCLMQWLNAKKNVKNGENYISYFWKSFECEICKTAYPLMIKSNGRKFHLVDYDRPTSSYLVLESLN